MATRDVSAPQTIVIAGAGLAGAKAAQALREEGFDGRVVLLGTEPERPYERPPLSKEVLRGEAGREKVYVHDEAYYDEHQIELRTGTAVEPSTRPAARSCSPTGSGLPTTPCCWRPARGRAASHCRGPTSKASMSCARSPTAMRWGGACKMARGSPSSGRLDRVRCRSVRVLSKLGLRDRVQAVVLAYETGLVEREMRP